MNENISFEEFEQAVMRKFFEKNNDVDKILQEQYEKSQVIKRDFTGVGFFTYFKVPEYLPCITKLVDRNYGNVIARINGSSFDYGFVLFLKEGKISCLEGYTWAEAWPETIKSYELHDYEQ